MKRVDRFSITIPSDPAKNPRICLMKWRSLSDNFSQSFISFAKSISSGVQKTAMCCLYLLQMSAWRMGKITCRSSFGSRSGSKGSFGVVTGSATAAAAGSARGGIIVAASTMEFFRDVVLDLPPSTGDFVGITSVEDDIWIL